MLLIYTHDITNRLKYVLDNIFREHWGMEYVITTDAEIYQRHSSPKLSYTHKKFCDDIFLFASPLLFQDELHEAQLNTQFLNNVPVLFAHDNKDAGLPFDVFAAVFYLLSRYEEYVYRNKDEYGNFDYRQSVLYQLSCLDKPVVEIWLGFLKDVLQQKFPGLVFAEMPPRFALSFDVDVAYEYKNKNVARTLGGLLQKVITFQWRELSAQLRTLFNFIHDCFDTYDYIFNSVKNKKTIFFFNMGKYGKYDKNPSTKNKKFRELIQSISGKHTVGLHPSYASNTKKNLVRDEKKGLENIVNAKVTLSRQHYLKLDLPQTYRTLLSAGIKKDFTMGYYLHYGFRAGTCFPFYFFDLVENKQTELLLYPFAVMDGTLNDVLHLTIEKAKKTITQLIISVCKYNGIFIPLWHNSTLSEKNGWKGWREVFEHTIKILEEKKFQNITMFDK